MKKSIDVGGRTVVNIEPDFCEDLLMDFYYIKGDQIYPEGKRPKVMLELKMEPAMAIDFSVIEIIEIHGKKNSVGPSFKGRAVDNQSGREILLEGSFASKTGRVFELFQVTSD